MMTCFVSPKVYLDYGPTSDAVCRGTSTVFTCITVSGTGYLEWINSSGHTFNFSGNAHAMVGMLGNITLTLTLDEAISNARIFISTAILNSTVEETTIQCSDGFNNLSRTVKIRSEFSTTQL